MFVKPNAAPLDSTFIFLTGNDAKSKTYSRFFRKNPASFDMDIVDTMSPPSPSSTSYINTHLYDGPTHRSYVRPSRLWERWYCSKKPWKDMAACNEFVTKFFDPKYHVHDVEVRVHPVKGRTLYAAHDIPKGYLIHPRDSANTVIFDNEQYENFFNFITLHPSATLFKSMYWTIDGYGFESSGNGFNGYVVTTTEMSFMNHGCNDEELNVNPLLSIQEDEDKDTMEFFNPVLVRRNEMASVNSFTLRDIPKGEELLFDYKHTSNVGIMDKTEAKMCAGGSGYFNVENDLI